MTLIVLLFAAVDPTVLAVAVAIAAPLGAYLVAVRRLSGKIGSSDAHDLWEESKAIRDWSSERLDALTKENMELRAQVARMDRELSKALRRVSELEAADA